MEKLIIGIKLDAGQVNKTDTNQSDTLIHITNKPVK